MGNVYGGENSELYLRKSMSNFWFNTRGNRGRERGNPCLATAIKLCISLTDKTYKFCIFLIDKGEAVLGVEGKEK